MKNLYYFRLCFAGLILFSCNPNENTENSIPFEKLSSDYSGVKFSNNITPNLESSENLFDYDYFYNGSGVGVADINNDGLKDIIFTANQEQNKLYLNKGNLNFEDITSLSNINSENKRWSSGVTFTDVNNDGWLDIYISQGGPYKSNSRKNLLLINNQD